MAQHRHEVRADGLVVGGREQSAERDQEKRKKIVWEIHWLSAEGSEEKFTRTFFSGSPSAARAACSIRCGITSAGRRPSR